MRTVEILRKPDDGTAAGAVPEGNSGESVQDNSASQDGTSESNTGSPSTSRPDYIPAKYWDEETGRARVADLGNAYNELATKLGKRDEVIRDEIAKELQGKAMEGVPDSATDYSFTPTEGLIPDGLQYNIDTNNAQYKKFGDVAHEIGLSQDQYNKLFSLYVENEISLVPDKNAELAKLGDNAQARVERVDMWAKANLTDGAYDAVVQRALSGEFIIAMEELIDKTGSVSMEGNEHQSHGPLTRQELETMMKDPRYRDPQRRDPTFVRRVQDGFASLKT
tara:strand:+ start:4204 stop:5040 length:837 start_codon:yes stop_codon:yes gene_type:complete